jgi:hypothetical protein
MIAQAEAERAEIVEQDLHLLGIEPISFDQ